MDHRIGILHAHSVSTAVLFHNGHHLIVGRAASPVALEFKHRLNPSHGHRACLNNALHSHIVRHLGYVTAAISHDVNFVTCFNCLNRWKSDAHLSPKPSHHDFFPAARLDR